jgi:hypothetical protein
MPKRRSEGEARELAARSLIVRLWVGGKEEDQGRYADIIASPDFEYDPSYMAASYRHDDNIYQHRMLQILSDRSCTMASLTSTVCIAGAPVERIQWYIDINI